MFVWLTIEIKDDENIFFLQRSSGRASFHIRKRSAVCVRRVDGSQCAARHTTFRALLRSSSIQEPRYPPLGDYLLPLSFMPNLFILFYMSKKKKKNAFSRPQLYEVQSPSWHLVVHISYILFK